MKPKLTVEALRRLSESEKTLGLVYEIVKHDVALTKEITDSGVRLETDEAAKLSGYGKLLIQMREQAIKEIENADIDPSEAPELIKKLMEFSGGGDDDDE